MDQGTEEEKECPPFPSSQSRIKFTLLCSLIFLCCLPWYLPFSSLGSLVLDLLHHELAAKSWDLPVRVYRLFIIWLVSWVAKQGKPNSVFELTSQIQFSMVCTLSNDVKMLTTEVEPQVTGQWFHCNEIRILWGCKSIKLNIPRYGWKGCANQKINSSQKQKQTFGSRKLAFLTFWVILDKKTDRDSSYKF